MHLRIGCLELVKSHVQHTGNNMIKYFQPSGTINGSNFFWRHLISLMLVFPSAFGLGFFIVSGNYILGLLCALLTSLFIYVNFINYIKRIRALFPEHLLILTIGLLIINLSALFFENESVKIILNLLTFGINMFLIFKNSNIENHEG